jgi:hypothetical protein
VTQQPSLFSVPRARRDDPETSQRAAASIPIGRVSELQEPILGILCVEGPHTDEALIARFRELWPERRATDQSIRSRRSELCRRGLVRATGRHGITANGGKSTVWRAT